MGSVNGIALLKERERCKRDEEAATYLDFVERIYGPFRSRAYTLTLLRFLAPQPQEHWLDAGAGVGRMSLELASRVRSLVCLDHSPLSLDELKVRAAEEGLTNIRTSCADLCDSPLASCQFDGILCNEVLQHIPSVAERGRCLDELYRMLKPGGRCLINVIRWRAGRDAGKEGFWGAHQEIYRNYFHPDEIADLMRVAGFADLTLRGLDILPQRMTRRLSPALARLDCWCAHWPGSVSWGNNILAIGTRPFRSW